MNEIGDETGGNMLVMPAAGGPRTPFLVTPFNERGGFLATVPAERTAPGIRVAVNRRAGREE